MRLGFSQCTASLAENYNAVLKYNYIYLDYISVSVLQWMSQSESDSPGQPGRVLLWNNKWDHWATENIYPDESWHFV